MKIRIAMICLLATLTVCSVSDYWVRKKQNDNITYAVIPGGGTYEVGMYQGRKLIKTSRIHADKSIWRLAKLVFSPIARMDCFILIQ